MLINADLIRDIKDPEHPHTLEELNVVREELISVCHLPPPHTTPRGGQPQQGPDKEERGEREEKEEEEEEEEELLVRIEFTPTVPHCSLATLIGLCLRVKLERSLQSRFKLDIFVTEGTHSGEDDVNKQINDKERVAAAMENASLREMVELCIKEVEY